VLAHPCLAITAAIALKSRGRGFIRVPPGEVRRLLAHLITIRPGLAGIWAWARWRRCCQRCARTSHYQRNRYSGMPLVNNPQSTGGWSTSGDVLTHGTRTTGSPGC
jgi:hypothetical protein